jgi:hypothetical protein
MIAFNKNIVRSAEMKFWHRLPENVLKVHFSTPERAINFMLKALLANLKFFRASEPNNLSSNISLQLKPVVKNRAVQFFSEKQESG